MANYLSLPRSALAAGGFLSVLLAPALLALAAVIDAPLLVVGVVLLVFPVMRLVFGGVAPSGQPALHWRVAGALDQLGLLYAAALAAGVAAVLWRLQLAPSAWPTAIGWALSLWATLIFATCIGHDLLHRRGRQHRVLGHVLAGMAGYPILGYEHTRHHRLPGSTSAAEWPRADESVWQFAPRRLRALLPETIGARGLLVAGSAASPTVRGMRIATGAMLTTFALFAVLGGVAGALAYGLAALLVAFAVQLVTYLQHWGLGDDNCADARASGGRSWECDCRFQAWVTMGLSLHQAHHAEGTRPYHLVGLAPDSPRLPMGYVLLMVVAMVPSVWRWVMAPALAYWKANPRAPVSAGRKLTCIGYYR